MARFDEGPLDDLEREWEREDPRFAHGLATGRPRRPREYRHGRTWLLLGAALALLAVGLALEHALPLSGGVILSGLAMRLYDRRRDPAPAPARRGSADHMPARNPDRRGPAWRGGGPDGGASSSSSADGDRDGDLDGNGAGCPRH
ncbi:DUF3040 domain-containing protein [Peterkaempfera bronchialis]|uniref:DUF3040 domain-containing protein n=1 Tax=Peterkaempfera bronchialis TaxID=2126346 RepID=UPI003C2F721F